MEPLTLVYALLGAAGLVGADAYFNSSTLYLQASVAPAYESRGFSSDVVETIVLEELNDIMRTKSVVVSPDIVSSRAHSISSAVAKVAGMTDALESLKSATGLDNPVLSVRIVVDKVNDVEVPRIMVSGKGEEGRDFRFSQVLTSDRPFEATLSEIADQSMSKISPYLMALHAFDDAEQDDVFPIKAEELVNNALQLASLQKYDPKRALFENLRGLIYLLRENTDEAERWFQKANASNPDLMPALLNVAFVEAFRGHYDQTIEIASRVLERNAFYSVDDMHVMYAALNLTALSYSQLGDFEKADDYFSKSAELNPNGVSVYYYWSNSYRRQGLNEEMEAMMALAEKNAAHLTNYPELASLYLWLPYSEGQQLSLRSKTKIVSFRK